MPLPAPEYRLRHAKTCTRCPLAKHRKRIVWGEGPEPYTDLGGLPRILMVFEGPGKQEDRSGRPLVGKTGREADHLLRRCGLRRESVWLDNVVRCRPKNDRDPKPDEIEMCSRWLIQTIENVDPDIICTVGAVATRTLLGYADMPKLHGIPIRLEQSGQAKPVTFLPMYHPASGLHNPTNMMYVQYDYQALQQLVKGTLTPRVDGRGTTPEQEGVEYAVAETVSDLARGLDGAEKPIVAVDTEWAGGGPWSIQAASTTAVSMLIHADNKPVLRFLDEILSDRWTTTILHNALYDVPVMERLNIHPARVHDTMIMAYLLQSYPQGLKPLAYRIANMAMQSYSEVVGRASHLAAMDYLARVVEWEWPDPDPVLVWDDPDHARVKQPQNILTKVARALGDQWKNPEGVDVRQRWAKMDGREVVEMVLGKMPVAELCDIPYQEALVYACRDAHATLLVYAHLAEELTRYELWQAFEMDMAVVPVVLDMMAAGIKIEPDHFRALAVYFEAMMEEYNDRITELTGHTINPGSHPAVRQLLFKELGLKPLKLTDTGLEATGDDILAQLRGQHPVVQVIRDWRAYQKLKTTYADPMPGHAGRDGRVRAQIRITRTATGRLSTANPNLMAQPVRSEDGRRLREGFVAEEGCMLVSADYCLAGDTVVVTTHGEITMEAILELLQAGEDVGVLSSADGRSLVFQKVTAAARVGRLPVIHLEMEDGSSVDCTGDHEWVQWEGGMVKSSDLAIGDRLAQAVMKMGRSSQEYHRVKTTTPAGVRDVYQLTVEDTHTYVLANGLVSGNSQIELRVMAHVSEDVFMLDTFQKGLDIHTQTASAVFGLPPDRVDNYKHRRPSKTVNFGIPYGMSGPGLYDSLAADGADMSVWTLDRCEEFIEEWFALYPGVRHYMENVYMQARRYGYVRDMWGRVRFTPGVKMRDKWIVAAALRESGNMPIQSGAQGVIKKAMAQLKPVYDQFKAEGNVANPLIQIHDDLVFEYSIGIVDVVVPVMVSVMETAVKLRVETPVDVKIGDCWGSGMQKWEKWKKQ